MERFLCLEEENHFMKTLYFSLLAAFLFTSCSRLTLNREEAAKVIRSQFNYPKVFEYDIYTADPATARKLLDAGLEAEGLVTIDKTQKLQDVGQPLIHFTEKAKPYLIRTADSKVQVVKIADVDLGEITGIQLMEEQKYANVEYIVAYTNISPFAKLINRDLSEKKTSQATLSYFDTGWKYDKNR